MKNTVFAIALEIGMQDELVKLSSERFGIGKLRQMIIESGKVDITMHDLKECWDDNFKLAMALSRMTVDVISPSKVESYKKCMNRRGMSIDDLYQRIINKRFYRLGRHVL